ncbi:MAG: glycosyltransferase family 2 protein [Dehalococcoidia bacterium]
MRKIDKIGHDGCIIDMDASIIILTKNGGANFPRLLDRIYSQKYSGSYEVIAIDSGSTDGTLEAAGKYPLKLVEIKAEEFHHGRTRNLGAAMAEGRFLIYITQDALPVNDGWLQKLTDNLADPQIAMVVGRQIAWEHTKPPEKFFYYYNFPEFRVVVKSGAGDYYHDNIFISNVNSAVKADIWRKYHFSESIVMAEDKEIAGRLLADGCIIVYEPEASVYHSHDHGIKGAFEKSLDFGLALRQGASVLPGSSKPFINRAYQYLKTEITFLNNADGWRWLPYSLIYETAKYTGLWIGKHGMFLGPMARKVRINNE